MNMILPPLPQIDVANAGFWASLRTRKLTIQRCQLCGNWQHYPRLSCVKCMSTEVSFESPEEGGVLHAFTVVHRHPHAAFKARLPIVVGLVELTNGIRLMSQIVDVEPSPDVVKIGMSLDIAFRDVSPEITVYEFRPAKGEG